MSKLINKTRLQKFAEGFWDKIKGRYDDAFVRAEIPATEKKIKFTKAGGGATVDVELTDYARLQDRNEFKQDVSADNVALANNSHIGSDIVFDSQNRSVGFRQLTASAFVDDYVDHIRVYVDNANDRADSTWTVWAITKDANDKAQDRVKKVICDSTTLPVNSITEGTETKKFVKIPVEASFEHETYFIVRCSTHKLQVVRTVKQEYSADAINMNDSQPPKTPGQTINWASGGNTPGNTAIMHLVGRESIGSLSLKLRQTQADSSLYVKHSDCINGTEQGEKAGKVVKLGTDGKLHSSLMPAIAINEFISVSGATWQESIITREYQNGDVIFHTNTQKRYLCVDTTQPFDNGRFVELNSKDGTVTSVEGKTGAVTLNIALEDNKFKLKINGTGGTETVKEIEMISEQDITDILSNLQ